MKKQIKEELWNDFVFMVKDATTNYESYYSSLVSWINKNQRYFTNDILKRNYLDVFISLEPKNYIIDDPEFQLEFELNRWINNRPVSIDTFAMLIGSKLWDMVSIRSDKSCPKCIYGGLRHLLLESKDKILLECSDCAWTEYADGSKYEEGIARMIPANKMDLHRHGIYKS